MVVVRFGDKYKQWNAAFDAGYASAMGTPYITLHAEDIIHPLKEVDIKRLIKWGIEEVESSGVVIKPIVEEHGKMGPWYPLP